MSATPIYPDLAGKVAVVTGGSKGIGAATCRALASNGARVAVVAREPRALEALVAELRAGGAEAIGISADCTSEDEVGRVREDTEAALGPVDLLAPFAGGFASFTAVERMTLAEWREVLEANLTSTFVTVRAFLPGMMERRSGSIVTMASNGGRLLDKPLQAAYAAAKGGVVMFTRHLALEMGPYGIRANAVAPATTRSERIERIMDAEAIARTAAMSPLGRLGTPADTANAALFLFSGAASWLTGITIDVAGGRIML